MLSSTCHEILRFLATNQAATAARLAEHLQRAPLTVHRALKELLRRKLVDKRETPQNGAGRAPSEWFLANRPTVANEPTITDVA